MTSRHQTETSLQSASTPHGQQPVSANAEAAYDRLTGYGFARRYVKGKIVADIDLEGLGYGSRLLAETAESVTALSDIPEAIELASTVYSAPNVSYRRVNLPQLPLPEGRLDVVVALGVVESLKHPEELVKEARRVLNDGGVFVISARDKQTNERHHRASNDGGRREMYVPELRELLERHFGQIRIYRQAAVAGGLVFPVSEEVTGAPVETARFSLTDPRLGVGPLVTRSVIAVCSDAAEVLGEEEQPYLLLDRDRRVFDECEERAEDIELLRGEIRQIQETEVQAFIEAGRAHKLPSGLLVRLTPQILLHYLVLHYLYENQQESSDKIRPRQGPDIEKARRRRDLAIEQTIEETTRYGDLIVEEMLHRRNLVLEQIIHRRNIIQGNIYAIRQKGAVGSAKGAYKRLSALYRRLVVRQKPQSSWPHRKRNREQTPSTQPKHPRGLVPPLQ
jgi:SAM-dependent methyltransferase